jgi:hypothetical protein
MASEPLNLRDAKNNPPRRLPSHIAFCGGPFSSPFPGYLHAAVHPDLQSTIRDYRWTAQVANGAGPPDPHACRGTIH